MPLTEPLPDYAERIRQARRRRGLERADLERLAGLAPDSLFDIEAYPDELRVNLSLDELASMCTVLEVDPAALLARPGEAEPDGHVSADELAAAIKTHMTTHNLSPEAFGALAGWGVEELLSTPTTGLAQLNVDGLFDICTVIGMSWLAALPVRNSSAGA